MKQTFPSFFARRKEVHLSVHNEAGRLSCGQKRKEHARVYCTWLWCLRGRVQQQYPRSVADNSRSSAAARPADRDCTGGRVVALLATHSFLPSIVHSLGALRLCVQEWGSQSIRRSKQRPLNGMNAARERERCRCVGANALTPGVPRMCVLMLRHSTGVCSGITTTWGTSMAPD